MGVLKNTEKNLEKIIQALKEGDVVAIPTETVYGLAANALDTNACKKIFEIKERPFQDPLICHIYSVNQAKKVAHWNKDAEKLANQFWPGALTLVLRKKEGIVSDLITGTQKTIALRMPAHPLMREILSRCDFPIAAPSANPFSYISPTSPKQVEATLGNKINYILDGGPSNLGLESTIIDLTEEDNIQILRPGPVTKEELEQTLEREIKTHIDTGEKIAPGLFKKHYSPKTPLFLFENTQELIEQSTADPSAVLLMQTIKEDLLPQSWKPIYLSKTGNLEEAASNLYAMLQKLDQDTKYQSIYAQLPPAQGIGIALRDRLIRAQAEI